MSMVTLSLSAFLPAISGSPGTPVILFPGGAGTPGDPYWIANVSDLQNMSTDLSASYILINDIDASATSGWAGGFEPIGPSGTPFSGSFNGQGYSITGLYIDRGGTDYVGLIGSMTGVSSLDNIALIDCDITGHNNVGGLAGSSDGFTTITDCYSTGSVSGATSVGGIAGESHGTAVVLDCHSTCAVSGTADAVGGIVGRNYGAVTNCYYTGSVDGFNYVGGIAGWMSGGLVQDSYNAGDVTGLGGSTGGLVGYHATGIVEDSYSTGPVSGNQFVGGAAGYNSDTLTNCYSTGNASGSSDIGGFQGYVSGGTTTNCFWDTETSGLATSFGPETGLTTAEAMNDFTFTSAGWDLTNDWFCMNGSTRPFLRMEHETSIMNSHELQLMLMDPSADYELTRDLQMDILDPTQMWGTSPSSGLGFVPVGNDSAPFTGSFNGQNHSVTDLFIDSNMNFAGLFGNTSSFANISYVNLEDVNVTGTMNVGGLCGHTSNTIIEGCTVTGNVSATVENLGGLIGHADSNTVVEDCTTNCTVTGNSNDNTGGLIGNNAGTVNECESHGYTLSTNNGWETGGLIGRKGGTVTNCTSYGFTNSTFGNVGGLIGYSVSGLTTLCEAHGDVRGWANTGGLVGRLSSSLTQSNAYGDVTGTGTGGTASIGGLIGWMISAGMNSCNAYGDVVSAGGTTGGLVGSNTWISFSNCDAHGDVTAAGAQIGGLVGYNVWASVNTCNAYGNVNGASKVGGLIGEQQGNVGNQVLNSNAWGAAVATGGTVGGLIGYVDSTPVTNCTSNGPTEGTGNVGGLIGYSIDPLPNTPINLCNAYGPVNGTGNNVGGLYGYNSQGDVIDSNAYGDVTTNGNSVGGAVGYMNAGTLTNCTANGGVSGAEHVGGLIGYNNGRPVTESEAHGSVSGDNNVSGLIGLNNHAVLTVCYSDGPVTGSMNNTGGLIGLGLNGTVTDCYSQGDVSGNVNVGGLIGNNTGQMGGGDVNHAYSSGSVSGNSGAGGLIGIDDANDVNDCFWDTETSGQAASDGGTAKTTLEMLGRATFDPPWDFTTIWGIHENQTYPFFLPGPPGVFSADMAVTIEASPAVVQDGDPVKVYVNITNNGPNNAEVVNCTVITSGAGLTYNGANRTLNTWGNTSYSWTNPLMMSGESAWIMMNMTANGAGEAMVNASVTAATPDPAAANDADTDNVTINAPPNAADNSYTTDEDTPLDETGGALLANDNDPNNDALTIIAFDAVSAEGVAVDVDPNGDFRYDHTAMAKFQELAVGESIADSFGYTISDGHGGEDTATVTITVNGLNDAPTAANDAYTVAEDSGATQFGVLANDDDIDASDVLSIGTVSQPANGAVAITISGTGLQYQPAADFNGQDTFGYTVSDGNGGTDTAVVTVTVTSVNDAPVITTTSTPDGIEGTSYSLTVNATDADGDTLTFSGTTDSTDLAISVSGIVSGTPSASGQFWFLVTVSDGNGGTDSANLTIDIAPDQDGDGIPDAADDDRDGDGAANIDDAFPDDPAETLDTDADGIGNNADDDDDGDGVPDADDEDPLDPAVGKSGGLPMWLYLVLILVIAGVAAGAVFMRASSKSGKQPTFEDEGQIEGPDGEAGSPPGETPAGVPAEPPAEPVADEPGEPPAEQPAEPPTE